MYQFCTVGRISFTELIVIPSFFNVASSSSSSFSMPSFFQVFLDKAFGFTIQSNTRISQSCDGTIAYLAGCVIVLYNCYDIQNQEFIISSAKKTLTCVAFSSDGRMIATGEVSKFFPKKIWTNWEKDLNQMLF